MQMKTPLKEYCGQCEILFHIFKQEFEKRCIWGKAALCFSTVPCSMCQFMQTVLNHLQ